jgi:hypothetical protein
MSIFSLTFFILLSLSSSIQFTNQTDFSFAFSNYILIYLSKLTAPAVAAVPAAGK